MFLQKWKNGIGKGLYRYGAYKCGAKTNISHFQSLRTWTCMVSDFSGYCVHVEHILSNFDEMRLLKTVNIDTKISQ